MKALILISALALTGCAGTTVYEVSAGANLSKSMPWSEGRGGGFDGGKDIARFAIRNEYRNGFFTELSHTSHWSTGWPINDKAEDWADVVAIGYRFQVTK